MSKNILKQGIIGNYIIKVKGDKNVNKIHKNIN